jgi:N-acetylmuramoyl-L-alanine amidase
MTAHSRMKRLLLAVLSWMIAMAAFGAQSQTAQVIYTYHDPLSEAVYRVADECYAPVLAVKEWGWQVQLNRDDVTINAEGKTIQVPVRTVGGKQVIPLGLALQKLGAETTWDNQTNTLNARSFVNAIKIQDGKLTINSSLPVKANIFAMINPSRLVVDIQGAKLLPDVITQLDEHSRMKQFKPDVVRVVVENPDAAKLVQSTDEATTDLTISLDPAAPSIHAAPLIAPPVIEDPDSSDGGEGAQAPPGSTTGTTGTGDPASSIATDPSHQDPMNSGALAEPTEVQMLVDLESSTNVLLLIRNLGNLSGAVQFRKPDPSTLDVVLPGVRVKLPDGFRLQTPSITDTIVVLGDNVTVIRFTLARPMGAQVSIENNEVRIQLSKPEVGNGKLAGKIVCIDAGHGGHDTGAHAAGVYEKNLTLSIAKKAADAFAEAGATVIMTRKTDVFIPLLDRNAIADNNRADFFIAIHINSNKLANSLSGGIAFHHKGSDTSKLLAECVQDEISQISKLPSLGAWSDGKIYQSGFSVLRNASQPAILLELGFINSTKDRARLQQTSFQNDVADAIVKGVQDFLGNGK